MLQLTIFVEGPADEDMVRVLLRAMNVENKAQISVHALGGKRNIAKAISGLQNSERQKFIALIDADEASVADSRELARHQLGNPQIDVFCAVPMIESWIFADPGFAKASARSAHAREIIDRAPLPEMIPYPKQFALNVYGSYRFYPRDAEMDINLAAARSPSLRAFVEGIVSCLKVDFEFEAPAAKLSDTRDVISTLLRELPQTTIVWRTLAGDQVTAGDLAVAIAEGSALGNQYATQLLRVARDLIARQSK